MREVVEDYLVKSPASLRLSYDRVAEEYAGQFLDELDKKPFDRNLLDRFYAMVGPGSTICDMGCGPGQVARYLHAKGAQVCGVDLSPEMVRTARLLNPLIPFQQGDMLCLDAVADNSYGGIAAFYSIIHVPRDSVVSALHELRRVLLPGGLLLLSFHIGRETVHKDEWWGKEVSVDFHFFETEEMKRHVDEAGLELVEVVERGPYPEVEFPSRRAYLIARKRVG